jgi:hypothetical protein
LVQNGFLTRRRGTENDTASGARNRGVLYQVVPYRLPLASITAATGSAPVEFPCKRYITASTLLSLISKTVPQPPGQAEAPPPAEVVP